MKLYKQGKTKDVYLNDDGTYTLKFKNTVTGHIGGEKDPGGNSVVGEVEGVALNALKVTIYYFELLKQRGIPSHYIKGNLANAELTVKAAKTFGSGLEFICRFVACGSFIRRYGQYIKEGAVLPDVFEVTLKDDERNDPPITRDSLAAVGLMTAAQYDEAEKLTKIICNIVKDDLAAKGMKLYDIKLEFGIIDGKVTLIDEISGGNMRVYKDGKKLDYDELSELIMK